MFNFPSSPTEGQQFTPPGGVKYQFTSGAWVTAAITDLTVPGVLTVSGPTTNAIEIGRMDGVASTPVIDFHSGATATDYDSRLVASGGTGTLGQGTLTVTAAQLSANGNILPTVTGTQNLGSATFRWGTVYTSDLSLNNGVGDWTIVEGADDLFITNNRTGKKYKFVLSEVPDGD